MTQGSQSTVSTNKGSIASGSTTSGPTSAESQKNVKYNRAQFFIILLTPLIIMAVSSLMYFSGAFLPSQVNAHGVLLNPVLSVTDLGLPEKIINGDRQWQLIQYSPICDDRCAEKVQEQRQIHIALGKLESRIDRLLMTNSELDGLFKKEYPRLSIDALNLSDLSDEFLQRIPAAVLADNPIFVVDPFGNIMLYFTVEHDYKAQMSDIKKLLKLSTIG